MKNAFEGLVHCKCSVNSISHCLHIKMWPQQMALKGAVCSFGEGSMCWRLNPGFLYVSPVCLHMYSVSDLHSQFFI